MSEKKIVVPEGMLEAAEDAFSLTDEDTGPHVREVLEAALRWLSENPIVPTDEFLSDSAPMERIYIVDQIVRFQRRMFLAPEPEVPEPEVPDWEILRCDCGGNDAMGDICIHNQRTIEAYRRGKESK